MKKILISLLLCFPLFSFAQNIYKGKVSNIQGKELPFANIMLYSLPDSTFVKGVAANSKGKFEIQTRLKSHKGFLKISYLSYTSKMVALTENHTLDIILKVKPYVTKEVEIKGKKRVIEFQDGNIVANVSEVPNAETSSVAKVLKQLPGVTANEHDGLTLNGLPAALYINGRKQKLSGKNLIKFLQALPAASINQIELKSLGDASQDASNNGSVINLKTKRKKLDGYFLSLGSGGQLYDYGKGTGNGNVFYMFKKNKVLFNMSLSYNNDYYKMKHQDSTHYSNNTEMMNSAVETGPDNTYIGNANLAWEFKKGHILNFNVTGYDDFDNNVSREAIRATNNTADSSYILLISNHENDDLWTGNIEYSSPDSLPSKLVASYEFDFGGLRDKNNYYTQLAPELNQEWYLYSNPRMIGYRHIGKVNFWHSFKSAGLKIQAGAKTTFGHLTDDVLNRENINKSDYPDSHFKGKENIYAGYAKALYNITPKLGVNAALRIEHTNYDINLISSNEHSSRSYTNYFPYFHLYYHPSKNYQTVLAYLTGIWRPNYEHMLPGIRYRDKFSYTKGNPDLNPTTVKEIVWAQYFFGHGKITLYYGYKKDLEGLVLVGKQNDVVEYTYKNYADNHEFIADIYLPFEFFKKKLKGFISGNFSHNSLIHPKNGYVIPKGRGKYWKGNVKGSLIYSITSNFNVNTGVWYSPKYHTPQYDYKSHWDMDMGFSYSTLKNKKLTFSLTVQNIYNTNKRGYIYYFGGNTLDINKHYYDRCLQFSLFIKFNGGQKIRNKARENVNDTKRFGNN